MSIFRQRHHLEDLALNEEKLISWWLCVCENHKINYLSTSYQTRVLDKYFSVLSKELAYAKANNAEINWPKIYKELEIHLLNWKFAHDIQEKHVSKRESSIVRLLEWVKQKEKKQSRESVYPNPVERSSTQGFFNKNSKIMTDSNLYKYWKSYSNGGFFSRRSEATRELDKSIHWFSHSIIVDRLEALHDLKRAIKVWQMDKGRNTKSVRATAVNDLKAYIKAEINHLSCSLDADAAVIRD